MLPISNNKFRLVNIALEEARKSQHRHKHGAVIFRQGKVLAKGFNETHRGHTRYAGVWKGSLHAEISALLSASKSSVRGCDILVVRRNLNNSRPCGACMAALKKAEIRKLFYSFEGSIIEEKV